jgi:hypothetical protein
MIVNFNGSTNISLFPYYTRKSQVLTLTDIGNMPELRPPKTMANFLINYIIAINPIRLIIIIGASNASQAFSHGEK